MLVLLPCGGTPQQRGHDHPEADADPDHSEADAGPDHPEANADPGADPAQAGSARPAGAGHAAGTAGDRLGIPSP